MKAQSFRIAALLSAALFSGVLVADDTEIYTGPNGNSSVRPNIVFIIDTSGSMDTQVSTAPQYDSTVTYPNNNGCDPAKVYWGTGTTAPTCSTTKWFWATSNKCAKSVTTMANTGIYQDRLAMWNATKKAWGSFSSSNTANVECQADAGVDGDGVNTSNLWAANGTAGPWTSTSSKQVSWASTGSSYTLYSANYLNYRAFAATQKMTRLEIVKSVFSKLIDSTQNINMAIVRFDGNSNTSSNRGGYFMTPMTPLTDTNRASLKAQVSNLSAGGFTPLAETLYEVTRFYRGEGIQFGLNTTPGVDVSTVYDAAKKYISPIEYQCQKNFVVLFTDGDPTYDTDADTLIPALPGFSGATGASSCTGDCLDELAQYLYKRDQRTDLNDMQNVITYTVGFTAGMSAAGYKLLNDTATKGGGKYFATTDVASITDAFTAIVTEILAVNTTFSAPAVSVNAFNRNTHYDQLYFALFRPSGFPYWDGNVKRYRIGLDSTGSTAIIDSTGANAIDPNTAFFKQGAVSWWTATANPDSDNVALGGASANMPLPRKAYTYMGTTGVLTNSDNLLHENNTLITDVMLGVNTYLDPVAQRTKVLQWARGVDVLDDNMNGSTTDARQQMGDPLHTEPVLVTYGKDASSNPDLTLYATTNEGYLHAVDTRTGIEQFSFMPVELLGNINTLMEGAASNSHPYGLDGPLSSWVYDKNNDGTISPGTDHVYLYSAMRRGGKNIYALDVTDRASPILKWTIKGGAGGTNGFAELGETWSRVTRVLVKWNGTARDVLIFGGGYDPNQEVDGVHTADTTGRAIYMVDANTGALLWRAGTASSGADLALTSMTNSIPSEVRLIDVNGNGYADLIYVGDMGGQIWRFDINENNRGAMDFATGGVIASLGGGTTATDNRRFYYPPSVSMSTTGNYFNIAIGSGYRGHPLGVSNHDAFFVLRDKNIDGPARDVNGAPVYTALTVADLYDATGDLVQSTTAATAAQATTDLKNAKGYYINLNSPAWEGEKVLAQALTLNSDIYFTTFTPVASASASCAPSQGTARAYTITAEQGAAVKDVNGDGKIDANDRSSTLVRGGIPPRPTVIITDIGTTIVIGTTILPTGSLNRNPIRSAWKRN